jgi:hypothetical protein
MSRRNTLVRLFGTTVVWSAILTGSSLAAQQQSSLGSPSKTQVVLLGTGNPFPDPDRSGPATAIVVNGSAYLVTLVQASCGGPRKQCSIGE